MLVYAESTDVIKSGVLTAQWPHTISVEDGSENRAALEKVCGENGIKQRIKVIKAILASMKGGEISVSAYDTAWVALVEDVSGSGFPQFPESLQWIVENQLSDGSWGDSRLFKAHDRIINTLACVVALKSWNIYPDGCQRGISFLKENMRKLEEDDAEHMPIGFEVAFPSMIEIARKFELDIPCDTPVLNAIYDKRNLKLKRIPREIMYKVPTTLLHSLEGMTDLDWDKLLRLQNEDGSFLCSPSSTAFALAQTKDPNCLSYLKKAVDKFQGGVPNVYPIDLFEHLWAVDRLERLGISRYFQTEIKDSLDYVYRYWTEDGISWASGSRVHDVDDTSMGFRLLRLHGYDVSADAFRHFEKRGEFFCFAGQSSQAITGIYNLNRASQLSFPEEKILEDANAFSYNFLREKQASNEFLDKWIIAKDLPGEIEYALDFPWYASLPRIEARFYLEQYGGEDDVWIGKTLYRMPCVNNHLYLDLAKLDFNKCQTLHQSEWLQIERWYIENDLRDFGVSRSAVLQAYFMAVASIFEPERASERLAWARTAVLIDAVRAYLNNEATTTKQRTAFVEDFLHKRSGWKRTDMGLVGTLNDTLRHLSMEILVAHSCDISGHLQRAWEEWLITWQDSGSVLLVRTINACAGRPVLDHILSHPDFVRLTHLITSISQHLNRFSHIFQAQNNNGAVASHKPDFEPIDTEMQELVQCVLQSSSDGIDNGIKQVFLTVAKSLYYCSLSSPSDFNLHMTRVLFEKVV